jgi:hypothetical protein
MNCWKIFVIMGFAPYQQKEYGTNHVYILAMSE